MERSGFIVGGQWRTSSESSPVVNPYGRVVVGEVCQAAARDIDDAIRSATAAFQETRSLQSHQRSGILERISGEVEARKERFAQLITAETGKPITYSRAEVDRSFFTFKYASGEAGRLDGSVLPLDLAPSASGRFGIVRRFPIGVIGAITPFNFPLNLVAHKLAPAIASGNSFVLKPSSSAPFTALLLGEILLGSGYPPGAVNIVPCKGSEIGQLIEDERVKLISFTGSPSVGWGLKSRAGKKKVVLELGGNAGVIVDRGTDIASCARRIAAGAYGNAGQSCIAVQRIYVHQELYDEFLRVFVEISRGTTMGDPTLDDTVIGPMIDESAARKVEGWVAEAVASGARIHCGGSRKDAMLEPTVLTGVDPRLSVSCQEVFAPVVTVDAFETFDGALEAVNHSAYGLQAGVFTNDLSHVLSAYQVLDVGGVIINDFPTFRIDHMPYGGVKDSGFGREGVKYAIEEMTEPKLLVVHSQPQS